MGIAHMLIKLKCALVPRRLLPVAESAFNHAGVLHDVLLSRCAIPAFRDQQAFDGVLIHDDLTGADFVLMPDFKADIRSRIFHGALYSDDGVIRDKPG